MPFLASNYSQNHLKTTTLRGPRDIRRIHIAKGLAGKQEQRKTSTPDRIPKRKVLVPGDQTGMPPHAKSSRLLAYRFTSSR